MSLLTKMSCAMMVVQIATVVNAQSRTPATPAEIVGGMKSCLSATTDKAVETNKLKADGWNAATVKAGGKDVDTSLTFFGKGNLLLMTDKTAKAPACFITASLPDAGTFDDVAYAVQDALGVSGKANEEEKGAIYFFPKGHLVQMTRTGKPDSPAVRIAVGFMAQ